VEDDQRHIAKIISMMEFAWNAGDAVGFVEAFADDADFINILGSYQRGRPALITGHRQIFDTIYKDSRITYTLERIRFLGPDVAVAFLHARLALAPGAAPGALEIEARPTMVLAREGLRWRIAAFQNTLIAGAGEDGRPNEIRP
jgi:uncharacterized protein (TIGR02246 family)